MKPGFRRFIIYRKVRVTLRMMNNCNYEQKKKLKQKIKKYFCFCEQMMKVEPNLELYLAFMAILARLIYLIE